jgi:hypothetical protein
VHVEVHIERHVGIGVSPEIGVWIETEVWIEIGA